MKKAITWYEVTCDGVDGDKPCQESYVTNDSRDHKPPKPPGWVHRGNLDNVDQCPRHQGQRVTKKTLELHGRRKLEGLGK